MDQLKFNRSAIRQVLIEADLEGLIKIGAPPDEYDSEADLLTERLNARSCSDQQEVLVLLCGVFAESFGFTCDNHGGHVKFKYEVHPSSMPKFQEAAQCIWNTRSDSHT